MAIPNEWMFTFFDLSSKESTRRVKIHRKLRNIGAAMHSESVYCMPFSKTDLKSLRNIDSNLFVVTATVDAPQIGELAEAYDKYIDSLIDEIDIKMLELEDAKANAVDGKARRGYSKRLNKMYKRIEHLEYIFNLRGDIDKLSMIDAYNEWVRGIDSHDSGKLV